MMLSVIVPVYKVEDTLKRCVDSILSQSFSDWELILVDDGSPDNSGTLCDEFAKADKRISVIHKSNGGLSDARNVGIKQANGDFITFIDSDDFISSDCFESAMSIAKDEAEVEIIEYPVKVHHGHESETELMFDDMIWQDVRSYWIEGKAYTHTYAWNKFYRRYLFDDVEFPVGKVFEDVWTLPLLLKKNPTIMTISKGMYYYCWNEKGITVRASGKELSMLLEGHLEASRLLDIPFKNDYAAEWYLKTLNIQLDVCRLCHISPILPTRKLPLSVTQTTHEKIKVLILNFFGINTLCKLKH